MHIGTYTHAHTCTHTHMCMCVCTHTQFSYASEWPFLIRYTLFQETISLAPKCINIFEIKFELSFYTQKNPVVTKSTFCNNGPISGSKPPTSTYHWTGILGKTTPIFGTKNVQCCTFRKCLLRIIIKYSYTVFITWWRFHPQLSMICQRAN